MIPLRSAEPVIILRQSNNHQRRGVGGFERYIFVLVQAAFVLLLCGSSYLAGSIYGHNAATSLLLNHGHSIHLGVGRLIHHHDDAKSETDFDCTTLTEEQLIEIYVKRELDKHNALHQAVNSEEEENLSRENEEDRSDDDNEDESDDCPHRTNYLQILQYTIKMDLLTFP